MNTLSYHRIYSTRIPALSRSTLSLRALMLRDTYATARRMGMTARASWGLAMLANDVGL